MTPILAVEVLSLSGLVIVLAVGGMVAAFFGKLMPAVCCLGVALVLVVLR